MLCPCVNWPDIKIHSYSTWAWAQHILTEELCESFSRFAILFLVSLVIKPCILHTASMSFPPETGSAPPPNELFWIESSDARARLVFEYVQECPPPAAEDDSLGLPHSPCFQPSWGTGCPQLPCSSLTLRPLWGPGLHVWTLWGSHSTVMEIH